MLFLGFLVFFVRVGILRGLEGLGLGILCGSGELGFLLLVLCVFVFLCG